MYPRWVHNYSLYLIASLIGGFFYVNTYNNSMAITINQQPTEWQAAYNPIDYVVTSTNYTEDGFKIIVDVTVNGVGLPRLLVPTNPITNDTNVDISRLIESYIGYDFDIDLNDNTIVNCPNSIMQVRVKFGEQYIVSDEVTNFPDLATSNTVDVLNTSFNYIDFIKVNRLDFYNYTNTLTRFLTNQPNNRRVPLNENRWLYFYSLNTDFNFANVTYKTYDASGTLLNTEIVINPFDGADAKLQRMPAGYNINNINNIIDNTVSYVTIQAFEASSGYQMSELFTYYLDDSCTNELATLHFQNELGGFDSFSFTQVVKKSWSKNTSNYKALSYSRDVGTVQRDLTRHQRRRFDTTTNENLTLISNWINEAESKWLRELWDSPVIYLELDGVLYAVDGVSASDYEEKQNSIDKLFNLEVNVSFSWSNNRQRW